MQILLRLFKNKNPKKAITGNHTGKKSYNQRPNQTREHRGHKSRDQKASQIARAAGGKCTDFWNIVAYLPATA
jgi:hypothetical protein